MPLSRGNRNTDSVKDLAVDADSIGVTTTPIKLKGSNAVGMYIISNTGPNTTHKFTLQVSPDDGTTWQDTIYSVTGEGNDHDMACSATQVRAIVSIAEGSASTVDVILVIT